MSEQIFISYRREGGDIYAKAICDALKVRGYSVFYDFDSLQGGYFDDRIYRAIEECNDFVLVLPPNSLDRCVNEDDWVRLEIEHAIKFGKNIIPVMLPGFSFPQNLPTDIANIARINGIQFIMQYFDRAVIPEIIDRLSTSAAPSAQPAFIPKPEPKASEGLEFTPDEDGGYRVSQGKCTDTEIIIPRHFNGKPVTKINDEAFKNFSDLKSITIPNSVTAIGDRAFYDCHSLTSITIPNSVTKIGWYAFWGCKSLTSITIPDSVTAIRESAFWGCESLTSITIPDSVIAIGADAFWGCQALTSITIPDSVTAIGRHAFWDCQALTSITIPNSVMSIGENAFDYCDSLKSVRFNGTKDQWRKIKIIKNTGGKIGFPPHIKTVRCTDGDMILEIFDRFNSEGLEFTPDEDGGYRVSQGKCTDTEIIIPRYFNGKPVTKINDEAFKNFSDLKSITIPNSVTAIGDRAFEHCESLTSITIPNSVTAIGWGAFSKCESLTSITIPDSVTAIGEAAFWWCESLTSITIPDSVTAIGAHAFEHCEFLTSITIPNSVTAIGWGAFSKCESLTSITIPDSVTAIGNCAFSYCESLTSITIPNSVMSIAKDAFYRCDSLKSIRFNGTKDQWRKIKFKKGFTWKIGFPKHSKIHCTDGDIKIR